MKNVAILGSTGSIGTQALQVMDELNNDFKVVILSGHQNSNLLIEQSLKYKPQAVIATDDLSFKALQSHIDSNKTQVLSGTAGILAALEAIDIDIVLVAITGAAAIKPTMKALQLGLDVALANKETIVAAGNIIRKLQQKTGTRIIPVDSEHSAIMQCLEQDTQAVDKLILTASGGPFRNMTADELAEVNPRKALEHPNWQMGKKITIDSATMMNKGLEVIEAHWLFGMDYDNIDVVIHPQSIIHSMVQYRDGSVIAQLGLPDMRVPIQYALTYPGRKSNDFPKIDFIKAGKLEFFPPDHERFPCLKLAYEAGKIGKTMPVVLNAANEVAVDLFLANKISFLQIPMLIEKVMAKHTPLNNDDLENIFTADKWARIEAQQIISLG
ncbi:MAG: 1-deoxy-D-xylulose-5-phosphate reductoisomerase [Peptococcaceae bacterium]